MAWEAQDTHPGLLQLETAPGLLKLAFNLTEREPEYVDGASYFLTNYSLKEEQSI